MFAQDPEQFIRVRPREAGAAVQDDIDQAERRQAVLGSDAGGLVPDQVVSERCDPEPGGERRAEAGP